MAEWDDMGRLTRELLDTEQTAPLAVLTYVDGDDVRRPFAVLLSLPCAADEEPAILAKLAAWLDGIADTCRGRARWLADQHPVDGQAEP